MKAHAPDKEVTKLSKFILSMSEAVSAMEAHIKTRTRLRDFYADTGEFGRR